MVINGNTYLIPNEILEIKKKQRHRKKNKWCNLYFFKNRKKIAVDEHNVKDDLVITSALQYQRNTFYKMSSISKEDDTFDYYYKLKMGTPKNIIKRKSRNGIKNRGNNWRKINNGFIDKKRKTKDGKFIVTFP